MGSMGHVNPNHLAELTVRVRIRGRDQRSDQGERPPGDEPMTTPARESPEAGVEIEDPVAVTRPLRTPTTVEEPMVGRGAFGG